MSVNRKNYATTEVTTAWTTVYEEGVSGYSAVTLRLKNTHATVAFSDARVQTLVGPGTADTDWFTLADWTAAKTLAAGATTAYDVAGVHDTLRVQLKCASTSEAYLAGHGV